MRKLVLVFAVGLLVAAIVAMAECPPPSSGTNPLYTNLGKLYCGEAYTVAFVPDDPNDIGEFKLSSTQALPDNVTIDGLVVNIVPNDVGSFSFPIKVQYAAEIRSYIVSHKLEYKVKKVGGGFHVIFSKD